LVAPWLMSADYLIRHKLLGESYSNTFFSGGGGVIDSEGGTHPNLRHTACTSPCDFHL